MQPAGRKALVRQDLPILFLAWLFPATYLLLAPLYQSWPGPRFSSENWIGMVHTWDFLQSAWPLALLFAFIAGVACSSLQMIGKRGMLIALSFCSVCVIVLGHFVPGRPGTAAFHLVLLMGLMAFSVYARQAAQLGTGAGLCASALLASGPETVPFAMIAIAWFAGEWVAGRGEHGASISRKTLCFGYSVAAGTTIIAVLSHPGWAVASFSCGPMSMAHLAPAVVAGLGLAYLARNTADFPTVRRRLGCISFVALGALSGSLAANPTCLVSIFGALDGLWTQKFGLFALLAQDPRTAYVVLATPVIGLSAACVAALRRTSDGTERSSWVLMLGFLLSALLLMIFDVRLAVYANALAIIPCAHFAVSVGAFMRKSRPTLVAAAVFFVVWLSGMNITHSFIGHSVLPGAGG